MKALFQKKHFRKYFYFLCFFILCICDQRVGSASGEIQLVCPNIVLMVLSCIALSHYPLSGFCRRSFWIPAIVFAAGSVLALILIWPNTYYHDQLISGVLAAILYGCVLIQTVLALCSAKKLPRGNHLGAGLLGLLMILMLLSHHDRYNGFLLCLSVLLLYLTDFTALECEWMLKSLGGAVLTAFFVFQGLAFVFRPYDSLRYLGLYANTNMNALFYQMVYCVFLCVFCIFEGRKGRGILKWGSFCFACAMWSFVLLTMCRSAVLGMGAATLLGLGITLWKQRGRGLGKGLIYISGLALGSALSFPVVYGAVRYLPAVFHHPVWFMDEYSEEKVHSWDPCDSEKYTDWRDVLQENFGRLFPGADVSAGQGKEADYRLLQTQEGVLTVSGAPVLLASAATGSGLAGGETGGRTVYGTEARFGLAGGETGGRSVYGMEAGSGLAGGETGGRSVSWDRVYSAFAIAGSGELAAAGAETGSLSSGMIADERGSEAGISAEEAPAAGYSVAVRFTIYRYYFSQLNLLGHGDSENGLQIDDEYYAPHAHNIVLQYAFNYGLPAGIVFLAYLVASGMRYLLLCLGNESDAPYLLGLLLFASIAGFGMMEIIWRYGQLSHMLLLLLPRFAWQNRRLQKRVPEIAAVRRSGTLRSGMKL